MHDVLLVEKDSQFHLPFPVICHIFVILGDSGDFHMVDSYLLRESYKKHQVLSHVTVFQNPDHLPPASMIPPLILVVVTFHRQHSDGRSSDGVAAWHALAGSCLPAAVLLCSFLSRNFLKLPCVIQKEQLHIFPTW
jgi:hypothetical protein